MPCNPNSLTVESGRLSKRLTVKRHFDFVAESSSQILSTSFNLSISTPQSYQKNLIFLGYWSVLNTLPPEAIDKALAELNKIIKDYIIDENSSHPFIAQPLVEISTPLQVAKGKRVFPVNRSIEPKTKDKFERLKSQWKKETDMLSSIKKKIKHPAYQEIVAMGQEVVPFILEELRIEPGHWFSALSAITQADPVSPEDNFEQAVAAWLKWGKNQGYIQ